MKIKAFFSVKNRPGSASHEMELSLISDREIRRNIQEELDKAGQQVSPPISLVLNEVFLVQHV